MKRLEPVLEDFRPHMVIVVGDVNSTLAAALTAVKLGIRVAHIEAGLRSFDLTMPEEINRRVTDTLADLLFVTEQSGVSNLQAEGVSPDRIFLVGNVMIDTLIRHRKEAANSEILAKLNLKKADSILPYAVLTLHRPSNVDQADVLEELLSAVHEVAQQVPVFFPVHPRTLARIRELGLGNHFNENDSSKHHGLRPLEPLGYMDFLCLMDHSRIVLTDSGGVQEETTVLGVPCLTLRNNTERPITVEKGTNQIVGTDRHRIIAATRKVLDGGVRPAEAPPLWDGKAARRIVDILLEQLLGEPAVESGNPISSKVFSK
jgi:UDP-N-acetylglucosamine 2-epimerase (non-hydrolysing)